MNDFLYCGRITRPDAMDGVNPVRHRRPVLAFPAVEVLTTTDFEQFASGIRCVTDDVYELPRFVLISEAVFQSIIRPNFFCQSGFRFSGFPFRLLDPFLRGI